MFETMKQKLSILAVCLLCGCTSLTYHEQRSLRELKAQGITVETPKSEWERPANPLAAGALNLLPGVGNFYLASGNAGQSEHYMYGFLNLLTWPFSVIWGIPEAAIDANNINKRDFIYYNTYELKK